MLPTQLQFFMKIYKIAFPGNQSKKFISSDSEFFTESESLFGLGKISTGKNRLLGIQPIHRLKTRMIPFKNAKKKIQNFAEKVMQIVTLFIMPLSYIAFKELD